MQAASFIVIINIAVAVEEESQQKMMRYLIWLLPRDDEIKEHGNLLDIHHHPSQ